jgi:hypothetical protein
LSAEIYEATVDPIDPPSSILLLLGSEKLPTGIRERPQLDSRRISQVNGSHCQQLALFSCRNEAFGRMY